MAISDRRISALVNSLRWEVSERTAGRVRYIRAGAVVDGCSYGTELEIADGAGRDELVDRAKRRTAQRLIEEGIA